MNERRKKKRDRHDRSGEEDEDAELLAEEETEGENTRGHRLSVQPSVIKFGTMREYQLQGLNWLIHLYDNGINGILADEMVCTTTLLSCACEMCLRAGMPSMEFDYLRPSCALRKSPVSADACATPLCRASARHCKPFLSWGTCLSSEASVDHTWLSFPNQHFTIG